MFCFPVVHCLTSLRYLFFSHFQLYHHVSIISIPGSSSQALGFLPSGWLPLWFYCVCRVSLPCSWWHSIVPFSVAASHSSCLAFLFMVGFGRPFFRSNFLLILNNNSSFIIPHHNTNSIASPSKVIWSHFVQVQQVIRQPIAALPKFFYDACMVLAKLQCPSGVPLRYTGCHISCSSPSLRSGSYCVLHPALFISSFVRYIPLRS